MNGDLAFCLSRFVEDQVELIDECLDKIQGEEEAQRRAIEKEETSPTFIEQRVANKTKKGTHAEDQATVDRFIRDLRKTPVIDSPSTVNNNETVRGSLRAELSTKLNASSTYIARLRNLAKTNPKSTDFLQRCSEAIDLLRRGKEFDVNYNKLCDILGQSDTSNCVQNVQQWWKETYGYIITEINQTNKQFNSAIGDSSFAILSPGSRIIQHAKTIVETQKPRVPKRPQKYDIVCEFVRKIQSIDEGNRQKINADALIHQLNNGDVQMAIEYAETWLVKRDAIRSQKEENPYEVRWQAAKAEYSRQRIAQESKKLALTVLMRRLAVGSSNTEQFDQKLKETVAQQKQQGESLPVITGDIRDPTAEELSLSIQLTNANASEWSTNTNGIREQFGAALCVAFLIPVDKIRIDGLAPDSTTLQAFVLAPYGKNVIDSLNGTAPDSAARIEAMQECCLSINAKIETITLGDFGLKVEDRLMDPQWNRKYTFPNEEDEDGQYWAEPLDRGGKPYYCPSGWMRFGVKVAENEQEFEKKWGNWHLAYHGTQGEFAASILSSGLRVSTTGCFYEQGRPRVYVSPSIEYCAHPRYARPWKQIKENGEISWYQLIFQCRVNPKSVRMIEPETLIGDGYKETVKVDPNFSNNELTWIIPAKEGIYYMNEDIICYGIMMRTSNDDPKELSQSAWWQHAHVANFPYDT